MECFVFFFSGLVNIRKTMERSTMFHGKTHYFDWAIFSSKLFVYQRVLTGAKRREWMGCWGCWDDY